MGKQTEQINVRDEGLKKSSLMVLASFASDGQPLSKRSGEEAVTIARGLISSGEYFPNPLHGKLWDWILELHSTNSPLNLVSLASHMANIGELGGKFPSSAWAELMDAVDSAEIAADNIEWYCQEVNRAFMARTTHAKLTEMTAGVAKGNLDLDQVEASIHSLKELKTHADDFEPMKMGGVLSEVLKEQESNHSNPGIKGATTGFDVMDKHLGGLQSQQFIIIAARPSQGKTALACNMVAGLCKTSHKSLFISLEMTRVQLGNRLVAGEASTTYAKASFEEQPTTGEHHRITRAMKDMNTWAMDIYDPPTATVAGVCAKIREAGRKGYDAVFVDYIGLIRPDSKEQRESRYMLITEASTQLKAAARASGVCVVCLAQLRRESERSDKPKLSDLRESGQLEQDADAVVLIHRPDRDMDTIDEQGQLLIAKNRNGPTGMIHVNFNRETMMFREGQFGDN